MDKIIHFIKYNNATVIILAMVLILGGSVLAAGPEAIGQRQTRLEGLDNTALLAVDPDKFNMDFKIENIQADDQYYYVTYSFLDLVQAENAWQYQLSQKTQPVSKKIKQDIGAYMTKFLAKHYEARVRELKQEKSRAETQGAQQRFEVTEYSGLVGRTLDLAAKIFPGYEPVEKKELPMPENFNLPVLSDNGAAVPSASGADNLTKIYNDYVTAHPEIFSASSTVPQADMATSAPDSASSSPASVDTTISETPVATNTPAIPEPKSVKIIELPASPSGEPVPEIKPTPVEPAPIEPVPAQ